MACGIRARARKVRRRRVRARCEVGGEKEGRKVCWRSGGRSEGVVLGARAQEREEEELRPAVEEKKKRCSWCRSGGARWRSRREKALEGGWRIF